jgi:hypothetical protein
MQQSYSWEGDSRSTDQERPWLYGTRWFITVFTRAPLLECFSAVDEPRRAGSSVIVSGYGLDDRAIEVRSPAEAKGFFL